MKTLNQMFGRDSAYWGERGNWLVVLTQNRDSDCLTRSNFRSALSRLGGEGETVAIEEASHWACGWVQQLVVLPDSPAAIESEKINTEIEQYPVLNEEDFSALENEEAGKIWADCFDTTDRVKYMRAHESEFEPRSFSDLIACARGKVFLGYASELLA